MPSTIFALDLPIACTLTEAELRERQNKIIQSVCANVLSVIPIVDGYEYRFDPTSEILMSLTKLVDLERQCCAFLTFRIVVEPQQPIRLEIAGPRMPKQSSPAYSELNVANT